MSFQSSALETMPYFGVRRNSFFLPNSASNTATVLVTDMPALYTSRYGTPLALDFHDEAYMRLIITRNAAGPMARYAAMVRAGSELAMYRSTSEASSTGSAKNCTSMSGYTEWRVSCMNACSFASKATVRRAAMPPSSFAAHCMDPFAQRNCCLFAAFICTGSSASTTMSGRKTHFQPRIWAL